MSSFYGNKAIIRKGDIGLGNVEDKSSSMIRDELTKANIMAALNRLRLTQVVVSRTEPTDAQQGDIWFVVTSS